MESTLKYHQQHMPQGQVENISLKQQNVSIRAIAGVMRRFAIIISQELRRSVPPFIATMCRPSQSLPRQKLHVDAILFGNDQTFLLQRWSLEQFALRLLHLFPKTYEYCVPQETTDNCIFAQPVGELKPDLMACLRKPNYLSVSRSKD
jgi:IS30 family transposase